MLAGARIGVKLALACLQHREDREGEKDASSSYEELQFPRQGEAAPATQLGEGGLSRLCGRPEACDSWGHACHAPLACLAHPAARHREGE